MPLCKSSAAHIHYAPLHPGIIDFHNRKTFLLMLLNSVEKVKCPDTKKIVTKSRKNTRKGLKYWTVSHKSIKPNKTAKDWQQK